MTENHVISPVTPAAAQCLHCGARPRDRRAINAVKIVACVLATVGWLALWCVTCPANRSLVTAFVAPGTLPIAYTTETRHDAPPPGSAPLTSQPAPLAIGSESPAGRSIHFFIAFDGSNTQMYVDKSAGEVFELLQARRVDQFNSDTFRIVTFKPLESVPPEFQLYIGDAPGDKAELLMHLITQAVAETTGDEFVLWPVGHGITDLYGNLQYLMYFNRYISAKQVGRALAEGLLLRQANGITDRLIIFHIPQQCRAGGSGIMTTPLSASATASMPAVPDAAVAVDEATTLYQAVIDSLIEMGLTEEAALETFMLYNLAPGHPQANTFVDFWTFVINQMRNGKSLTEAVLLYKIDHNPGKEAQVTVGHSRPVVSHHPILADVPASVYADSTNFTLSASVKEVFIDEAGKAKVAIWVTNHSSLARPVVWRPVAASVGVALGPTSTLTIAAASKLPVTQTLGFTPETLVLKAVPPFTATFALDTESGTLPLTIDTRPPLALNGTVITETLDHEMQMQRFSVSLHNPGEAEPVIIMHSTGDDYQVRQTVLLPGATPLHFEVQAPHANTRPFLERGHFVIYDKTGALVFKTIIDPERVHSIKEANETGVLDIGAVVTGTLWGSDPHFIKLPGLPFIGYDVVLTSLVPTQTLLCAVGPAGNFGSYLQFSAQVPQRIFSMRTTGQDQYLKFEGRNASYAVEIRSPRYGAFLPLVLRGIK